MTDFYKKTKIIEQACADCLLRITAWKPLQGDQGFVDVQVVSNQTSRHHMILKNRFKNAWKVLRGNYDWSGFEVTDQAEAEALVHALQVASKEAFPSIISGTTIEQL